MSGQGQFGNRNAFCGSIETSPLKNTFTLTFVVLVFENTNVHPVDVLLVAFRQLAVMQKKRFVAAPTWATASLYAVGRSIGGVLLKSYAAGEIELPV